MNTMDDNAKNPWSSRYDLFNKLGARNEAEKLAIRALGNGESVTKAMELSGLSWESFHDFYERLNGFETELMCDI